MPTVIAAPTAHRFPAAALAALVALAALGAAVLLLPGWAWFGAVAAPVLGIGDLVAEARRSAFPDLPRVRHVPGE